MTSVTVLQALQSMEFTQNLEPKHLEKLASIATHVTFSEGATIFREGDASELVYLIEEGQVSLVTQVPHPCFRPNVSQLVRKPWSPHGSSPSTLHNCGTCVRRIIVWETVSCGAWPRSFPLAFELPAHSCWISLNQLRKRKSN